MILDRRDRDVKNQDLTPIFPDSLWQERCECFGQVEQAFRDIKAILETKPVYHQREENIRGHIFCSFLALVLGKALDRRLEEAGH